MEKKNPSLFNSKPVSIVEDSLSFCKKHKKETLHRNRKISVDGDDWIDISVCLDCQREEEETEREQKKQELLLQERARKENIIANLKRCGIPKIFREVTLDSFVLSDKGLYPDDRHRQNHMMSTVKEFLEDPECTGLVLLGIHGTGKNHIACAIAREVYLSGRSIYYEKFSQYMRDIKVGWNIKGNENDILKPFREPFLLILDEIGRQFGSDTERDYLEEIIDYRYEEELPTILMSNETDGAKFTEYAGARTVSRYARGGGKSILFDWKPHHEIKKENQNED